MSRLVVPLLFVIMGLFIVSFTPPDKPWWLSPDRHALAQTAPSPTPKMPLVDKLPFEPDRVAAAEVRMWKAYYDRKIQEVGFELIALLVGQFHLSAPDAFIIAVDLSSATLAFQSIREDYQTQVLPGLRGAYGRLKILTNGAWDAEAAARAELEWWVKRRTPGHNSQEEVGRSIAKLYTILYGKSNKDIERAGLLRARAAHIRDTGSDWSTIRRLLQESYRLLARGIQ
jgi:hypothetical protein